MPFSWPFMWHIVISQRIEVSHTFLLAFFMSCFATVLAIAFITAIAALMPDLANVVPTAFNCPYPGMKLDNIDAIETTMLTTAPTHAPVSSVHISVPHSVGAVACWLHLFQHLVPSSCQPLQPWWHKPKTELASVWKWNMSMNDAVALKLLKPCTNTHLSPESQ